MFEQIATEFLKLLKYFVTQLRHILPYWALGIFLGSLISVFAKGKILSFFSSLQNKPLGILGLIPASILGIASPLCMYGTIPIAASFAKKGMREDWLAAFMMSSMLLNPQLIMYSFVLGDKILLIRIIFCFIGGILAGLLVRIFFKNKEFFSFKKFHERRNRDTHPNPIIRLLLNMYRNIKITGPYFLIGIVLTVLFMRYLPHSLILNIFGKNSGVAGIIIASIIAIPLYVCGGGTIAILLAWLQNGMSFGSALAFMLSGPATKITNLGALKIVFSPKKLILYLSYIMLFAIISGIVTDIIF